MIIGRKDEQIYLKEKYDSGQSEFIAVYGRRRVGKTFLIRETFDNQFVFQHSGVANGTYKEQLRAFCSSLNDCGLKPCRTSRAAYRKNCVEAFHFA